MPDDDEPNYKSTPTKVEVGATTFSKVTIPILPDHRSYVFTGLSTCILVGQAVTTINPSTGC
jgi:hypothetical protein